MKRRTTDDSDRVGPLARWAVHPFLFAIYPVAVLCAENIDVRPVGVFLLPLGVLLAITVVLLVVGRLVLRSFTKAAFATSVIVFLFFAYGPVYTSLKDRTLGGFVIGRDAVLLPAWGVLAMAGIVYAVFAKRGLPIWTVFLNAVALVMVALPVARIVTYEMRNHAPVPKTSDRPYRSLLSKSSGADRDIYYFVFDRYPGSITLRDHFGYNNAPFLNHLRSRGFFVSSRRTLANYSRTSYALPTSLNMEYLDHAGDVVGRHSRNLKPVLAMLHEHRVGRILKRFGYRFINVGSFWQPTESSALADVNTPYEIGSDASRALLQGTVAFRASREYGWFEDFVDPHKIYWRGTARQFDHVKRISRDDDPTFTFAHILLPHDPYVYDAEGNYVPREVTERTPYREKFIEQLVYTNNRIMEVVDELLDVPEDEKPIIIIQSDEGPVPPTIGDTRWIDASVRQLQFKFQILSAYHFPGVDTSDLYPEISPVNSFRAMFNLYYDADLPFLPDKAFVSREKLYDFVDVTDRIRATPKRGADDSASDDERATSASGGARTRDGPSPSPGDETGARRGTR